MVSHLCCVLFVLVSSYLHCEWATEQQLEKDKRIQQKIKRFKMKQAQRALFFADVSLFLVLLLYFLQSVCNWKSFRRNLVVLLHVMSIFCV